MGFINTIIRYIYHFIILFGFIDDFPVAGAITSRRLSFVLAFFAIVFNYNKVKRVISCLNKRKLVHSIILLLFCFVITYFHHQSITINSNQDVIESWYYIYELMYVLIFALYCTVSFKSFKELAIVWVSIMLLESVIIFMAAVSTPVRLILYELFYVGDDRFEKSVEWGTRIVGIGITSATGSLTMSTAVMMLTFLKIKNQISQVLFLFLSFIIISATAFVGRTGVIVEAGIMAYYFVFCGVSLKKTVYFLAGGFLLISSVFYILQFSDSDNSEYLLEWMTGAFDKEHRNSTVEGITEGGLPPFNLQSFLGTGVASGYVYDGKLYDPDSGFIRLWLSIGLIGFLSFYSAMFHMLTCPKLKKCKKTVRRFILFAVLLAYIVEFKEPFMMKYVFAWSILAMGLFASNEDYRDDTKCIGDVKIDNQESELIK